ncbi:MULTISPECIES: Na+/H+ antiporter NhaA [unclassified Pseudoclavibacter]|uniref:Na+/H+ antiporter NhaA n=1 Tax=unclassified Pseudoclavibacter TaxID=2615177 RepID=UPI001BABC859|nr:Na+/H+ antiporter NhaA [Pseudoclavibacter sp. Marseille-Q4354]MBS3178741.1 Na+/H+ antiporter NhaA [Pseudoclavibacter sp. Marseille-Q4354]
MTAPATRPTGFARLNAWIMRETTGGALLLFAAAIALIWANSPWRGGYEALSAITIGPAAIHLDLSLATWAADGLLAVFFFTVGVELKHEFVSGSLRKPKEAAVPVLGAVAGMAMPAILYVIAVSVLGDTSALHGWAIPTATDIAFALGVLAIFGRGLPRGVRTFLLTLAVVDDLLAIVIIAIFYTAGINLLALLGSLVAVGVFLLVVRSKRPSWWLLLPIAIIAWVLMHEAGVHATIAGVLLGFCVPSKKVHGETDSRTHRFGDKIGPFSSGFALPVFAFFAAGVNIVDGDGLGAVVSQPVFIAIAAALVLGKLIGVLGMTALVVKLTPLRLPDAIGVRDLLPVGFLTGIGFTVSLLIAELSFPDSEHTAAAKLAVLGGSLLAAVLAAITLRHDAKRARSDDMNEDGIPDIDRTPIGSDADESEIDAHVDRRDTQPHTKES